METDKKTILLVDDDEDMLAMEELWLTKDGYTVIKASSGPEALDSLKALRPHLILLDFDMPGMDGVATLTEIRNAPETKDLPVFFLTGMEELDMPTLSETLHPQGHLSKASGKKTILSALADFFADK